MADDKKKPAYAEDVEPLLVRTPNGKETAEARHLRERQEKLFAEAAARAKL